MLTISKVGQLMLVFSMVNLAVLANYEHEDYSDESSSEEDGGETATKSSKYTSGLDLSPYDEGPSARFNTPKSKTESYKSSTNYKGSTKPKSRIEDLASERVFASQNFGISPLKSQSLSIAPENIKKTASIKKVPNYSIQTEHSPNYHVYNSGQGILAKLQNNPAVAHYFKPLTTNIEIQHPKHYRKYDEDETHYSHGTKKSKRKHYVPGSSDVRTRRYATEKRRRNPRESSDEDEDTPYDYSSDYHSRPKVFDSSLYNSHYTDGRKRKQHDDDDDAYDYGDSGYNFKEYERIKSLSEQQAAEIKKNPENCKQERRDSMTCTICKDPKTGGNFESCAYEAEPKNNKYAYSKDQKFDSNDQPDEPEQQEKETQPAKYQANESKETSEETSKEEPRYKSTYKPNSEPYAKLTSSDSSNKPYEGYKRDPKSDIEEVPYKSYSYGSSPKSESLRSSEDDAESSEEHDKEGESYDYKAAIPGFYTNTEPKKDVEHVLAEFKKKDRSSCNKVNKNGMTCFQCIDKSGLKHEECMFISESAPKRSHLAYQELKEYSSKPPSLEGSESQIVTSTTSGPLATPGASDSYGNKLKRKKVSNNTPTSTTSSAVIPDVSNLPLQNTPTVTPSSYSSKRRHQKSRINKRSHNSEIDPDPEIKDETNIAPPEEFSGDLSRGAFWAEMEPRYSKTLGVSLPEFMLSISEHEAAFDEAVAGNN